MLYNTVFLVILTCLVFFNNNTAEQFSFRKHPVQSSTPYICCGLNTKTGMDPYEYYLRYGTKRKNRGDSNELIFIARAINWNTATSSNRRRGRIIPSAWLTKGGKTAIVLDWMGMQDGSRHPAIFIDDNWLDYISYQTGTSWARTAVLAHELGHVYHEHLYDRGRQAVWDKEYQADYFAGFALFNLGASLEEAQSVFYIIGESFKYEHKDNHPSLKYRLEAVRNGWIDAGGIQRNWRGFDNSIQVVYGASHPYGAKIEIEGRRYSLSKKNYSIRLSIRKKETSYLYLWECPPSGCKWTKFRVKAGLKYSVTNRGSGRQGWKNGLKLH